MKKIMMGDINSGKLGGVDNITLFCEKGEEESSDCDWCEVL